MKFGQGHIAESQTLYRAVYVVFHFLNLTSAIQVNEAAYLYRASLSLGTDIPGF